MGFFKGGRENEPEDISREIANKILAQEDRLKIIFEIFDKLPEDLVEWATNTMKLSGKSKGYSEVDLATSIHSTLWLPGDLIIRKNRDPKIGDIVEFAQRFEDTYHIVTVKVLKLNVKDSTAYVQNIIDPEGKGLIATGSVISVIDKIIKYNSPEWKKLVQLLSIDYDKEDVITWVEGNIEHLKKSEGFHDKENNLKKLEIRLKELKQK